MRKLLVCLAAGLLLCCACNGDYCKCTTKNTKDGSSKTFTLPRPDGGKCSDLESDGVFGEDGASIQIPLKTTCKTVSEPAN